MVSRALIVTTLLALLAPAAADARRSDCWPRGSRTLQQSEHARVYAFGGEFDDRAYGCLYTTGRRTRLDTFIDGDPETESQPPYRLSGPYVAHVVRYIPFEAYQGSEYGVDVLDLRTGTVHRHARDAYNDGEPYDPETPPDPSLRHFRLTKAGNAAWLALERFRQVWRLDSRGPAVLDQGHDLRSLRVEVAARRITWLDDDGTRKAASFR